MHPILASQIIAPPLRGGAGDDTERGCGDTQDREIVEAAAVTEHFAIRRAAAAAGA